jgi:two-component sensor histidine kinase
MEDIPGQSTTVTMETVLRLQRQQAALASFGSFAFREPDLLTILNKAAQICADSLNVPFCKVCRYRPKENDLLIEAGYGWQPGVIGRVVSPADESTPQGRAYVSGEPVIIRNLQEANDLALPAFYAQHGITSTIDVVIKRFDGPAYGVLEIDSPTEQRYGKNDINFLTGFANVLAEAVATQTRVATLTKLVEEKTALVEEKSTLVDEKNLLARELSHRVRNHLQLIQALLDAHLETLADGPGKQSINTIALRLMTMAQMYDHLLGSGMSQKIDFGAYVEVLCANIVAIQRPDHCNVDLACITEPMLLGLDMVTSLGLVVAELVTNCYVHAFPNGMAGTISVSMSESQGVGNGVITIKDDGVGFPSETESRRHGLGLVLRLMDQLDGSIDVGSRNGTTCTLTFPIRAIS